MSIKVTKSGKTKQIKHYKTKCACGCEFEFCSKDMRIGSFTGKEYVICPECSFYIYNEWFNWKKVKKN